MKVRFKAVPKGPHSAEVRDQNDDLVAKVYCSDDTDGVPLHAPELAKVFAVSPDMLAVCQMLAEWWKTKGIEGTPETDKICTAARRVLQTLESEK